MGIKCKIFVGWFLLHLLKDGAVRRQDYAADERLLMREGGLGWNVGNIVSIYCD